METKNKEVEMKRENKADFIGKIIVIGLIGIFVLVGIITLMGNNSSPMAGGRGMAGFGQGSSNQPNAVTVSVKTMVPETIQKTVLLNGDVTSLVETSIYPDTSGKVSRLLKKEGDSVRRGEVIAYVDPSRPGSAYASSPVTATVAGTLIQCSYNVGDTVNTNNALAVIGSLDNLEVTVRVSEKYSAYLKTGLPAYISLISAPEETFNATVTSISPVVNTSNRTQDVSLTLDQQDPRIKPGMFAQVRLVVMEEKDSFVVPLTAIKDYNDQDTVFVVTPENTALRKIVKTGMSNDDEIQILEGLAEGDQVITAGSVTEGLPVRIAGSTLTANEE